MPQVSAVQPSLPVPKGKNGFATVPYTVVNTNPDVHASDVSGEASGPASGPAFASMPKSSVGPSGLPLLSFKQQMSVISDKWEDGSTVNADQVS